MIKLEGTARRLPSTGAPD